MKITQEQFEAAVREVGGSPVDDSMMRAAFAAAGITVSPPERPNAMVKLAREICVPILEADDWPRRLLDDILRGEGDDIVAVQAALAALQHAAKVVRDAPYVAQPAGVMADRSHILRQLGDIA